MFEICDLEYQAKEGSHCMIRYTSQLLLSLGLFAGRDFIDLYSERVWIKYEYANEDTEKFNWTNS